MRRTFAVGWLLLLSAVSAGRGGPPEDHLPDLTKLVAQLSDPDPQQRLSAQNQLIALHDVGRGAVRAVRDTAPVPSRAGIDRVLLHTNWVPRRAAPGVRNAFLTYADETALNRTAVLYRLLSPDGSLPLLDGLIPVLLKVLQSDPSPAVRWTAAVILRDKNPIDPYPLAAKLSALLDKSEPPDTDALIPAEKNAPLIAAVAWTLIETEPEKATQLFTQVADMQRQDPTSFAGEMGPVYLWLTEQAAKKKDYAATVQLLREEADYTGYSPYYVPRPISSLLMAQAKYGPFPGIGNDLRTYREYLHKPEALYALAELSGRRVNWIAGAAVAELALAAGGDFAGSHFFTGEFLASQGRSIWAQAEFAEYVRLGGAEDASYYFHVAAIAAARSDDLHAAQYLEKALNSSKTGLTWARRFGGTAEWSEGNDWYTCNLQYLRVATAAHDADAMTQRLQKLQDIDEDGERLKKSPGVAADIIPALQALGRTTEADEMFNNAYAALKKAATDTPTDPMALNNLAWLCAHTGRHLVEARTLADRAVALTPDDPTVIDTQSETRAKTGDFRSALDLEIRALSLDPENVYMAAQVRSLRKQLHGSARH